MTVHDPASSFSWQSINPDECLTDIEITIINKGTTSYKLISFADDTRVYSNIAQADDGDNLQSDLNTIYNCTLQNNMIFNSQKFHCISYSSYLSSYSYNVYANPNMGIINHQIMFWILAYLCLVTVPLSSTSKTYVKNVQTCLAGS